MPSAPDSQLFNQSSFPSWVLDLLVSMGPFGKAHRPVLSMFLSVQKICYKKPLIY